MNQHPLEAENARLVAENATLDEQIKLLVRTEQRLYRMKSELDLQLDRIRALGDFALTTAGTEDPSRILSRALDLIVEQYDVERAWTAYLGGESNQLQLATFDRGVRSDEDLRTVRPEVLACLSGSADLQLLELDHAEGLAAARSVIDALGLELPSPISGQVACLVLRNQAGRPMACIIAHSRVSAAPSFYRGRLTKTHGPFLRLLANHVKSALERAELTTRLREGSHELEFANARLTESLATIEKAQQQLLQGQKLEAIGRLAGGVAHDFNNLLTVILSHAHFLEDKLPAGSSLLTDAAAITSAGERAARITSQLLAFSRQQKRSPQVVDINDLVNQSAGLLCRLIGEHILLKVRTDAVHGNVRADPGQLEQIVLNLVVNARDAMPQGGTCTIETRSEDGHGQPGRGPRVVVLVSDTGVGMDASTRAQVFEPFFTTKDLGRGTGLGLATVYGLVQQNDGVIEVASEIGKGSTFTISFPVVDASPTPNAPPTAPHGPTSHATILLVEDESRIRDVAARALREAGYTVMEAGDGEDALSKIAQPPSPIDLVVSDVVMPRMGGIELAREAKEIRPATRFLFMSGYTFDAPHITDSDAVLQKPFTPDVLIRRVRELLAVSVHEG